MGLINYNLKITPRVYLNSWRLLTNSEIHKFVSTEPLTVRCLRYFRISIAMAATLNLLLVFLIIGVIDHPEFFRSPRQFWHVPVAAVWGVIVCWGLTFLASAYYFLRWNHTVIANLPSVSSLEKLDFSPHRAVILWFIPLVNLYGAFRSIDHAWRASQPEGISVAADQRWPALNIFWTVWIVGNITSIAGIGVYSPFGVWPLYVGNSIPTEIFKIILMQGLLIWSYFLIRTVMAGIDDLQADRRNSGVFD